MKRAESSSSSTEIALEDDKSDVRKRIRLEEPDEQPHIQLIKTLDNVDYSLINVIGEGVFGIVFEVFCEKQRYAMKVMKSGFRNAKEIYEKEVSILGTLADFSHDNVLNLIRCHTLVDPPTRCTTMAIVTELLGPSLNEVICSAREAHTGCSTSTFPIEDIRTVGKQILKSMIHLESLHIYHLDLKPANIFFVTCGFQSEESIGRNFQKRLFKLSVIHKEDLRVRIGDFGSAHQCLPSENIQAVSVQMQNYRAPEIFLGLPYNSRSDVWSFGCVLCEMYTGEPLFYGNDSYDTEAVQFESMQTVVQQASSQRLLREAFAIGSPKVEKTKFGYRFNQNARKFNHSVPLLQNMRRMEPSAALLFMLLRNVLIVDPWHRPSFERVNAQSFFQ